MTSPPDDTVKAGRAIPCTPAPLRILLLALAWLAASDGASTSAQLPLCRLTTVFPCGAAAGTSTGLTITGSDLDEASALIFSDPRITASPRGLDGRSFQVSVPAELEPGLVEVRIAGRFGVSNPRCFAIGRGAELTAPATNTAATIALELPLEATFNGRCPPNQALWFRCRAAPTQSLSIEVEARELDSRLVPDLAVLDSAGRELSLARRREWLEFAVPADGRFLVRLRDQTYRGGDDFGFRLRVTAGPLVAFALPSVLQSGSTNVVTLFGRRFPGGRVSESMAPDGRPWEELTVSIVAPASGSRVIGARKPAASALSEGAFSWTYVSPQGSARPLVFGLSTEAITVLRPQGTGREPATCLPPRELAGLFPRSAAPVITAFHAEKGEVLWLEQYADRLGFNADPWTLVQRVITNAASAQDLRDVLELGDTEANAGGREFDTSTRDAAGRFEAPETGTYAIRVRDQLQSADRPWTWPFRLSLRRPRPDFHLAALPQPPPRLNDADRQIRLWTTVLRRGETLPIRVVAFRQDGFDGEIELTATNLPPGVSASPARIPPGQNATSLLLTAAPDAPAGWAQVSVMGRARVGETYVEHVAAAGSSVWEVPDWDQERGNGRTARDLVVSVCGAESTPVALLGPGEPGVEATAEGKVLVPLSVRRSDGFTAAFKLKAVGRPELEKLKEIEVAERATNAVLELNLAEAKLPPGAHRVWFQGWVAGKYRNNPEALAAAETALKAAEKASTEAAPEGKAAADAARITAEAARKMAEERARPRDVTVPVYSTPMVVHLAPPPAPPKP